MEGFSPTINDVTFHVLWYMANAQKLTHVHTAVYWVAVLAEREIVRLCQMLTLNLQYTGKKVNYLPDVRCKFADDA